MPMSASNECMSAANYPLSEHLSKQTNRLARTCQVWLRSHQLARYIAGVLTIDAGPHSGGYSGVYVPDPRGARQVFNA